MTKKQQDHHSLGLQGQKNCRDLGGYTGLHGQKVIANHLFRSGQLHLLTAQDIRYLNAMPIISIVDFRSFEEQQKQPNVQLSKVKNNLHLPINTGNLSISSVQTMIFDGDVSGLDNFFIQLNKNLVLEATKQYQQFFHIIQSNKAPIIFHCTAGKDRTGLASALLLSALGVDEHTILQDYLASNLHTSTLEKTLQSLFHTQNKAQEQALNVLVSVKSNYLQAAFNVIHEHYGSTHHYLTQVLGADLSLLQDWYLE